MEKYLEAGVVVNTHGVRGDVKVKSLCDSPAVLTGIKEFYIKEANGEFKRLSCPRRVPFGADTVLLRFEGCETFEEAVKYKNRTLYADREDIPKGENDFFIADIIGLPVIDADSGIVYGKVTDVFNQGAQDLYEVQTGDGEKKLIPAVPQFITEIDISRGLFIRPIEGLI